MKAPLNDLAEVIGKRSLNADGSQALPKQVAAYLLTTRRTDQLSSLIRDIQEYWAKHGIINVTAISAFGLSESVRSEIKQTIKKYYPESKKIIISEQLDPSVVGGLKLELANRQLDMSVRSKLDKFKQLTVVGDR